MAELYRVQESEVQPWQSNVGSSRVKYSVMVEKRRVQQSEVEPWQSNVESHRVKQCDGKVMPSQVK